MSGEEEFALDARDVGGEWVRMSVGDARYVRRRLVAEAGFMAQGGWDVVGMNRNTITVAHPDDDARRTTFKMRRVQ